MKISNNVPISYNTIVKNKAHETLKQDKNSNSKVTLNISQVGLEKCNQMYSHKRTNKILKNLMEQKENLLESKNKTITDMTKKGCDAKSIKEKIKDYDKQLKEIDEQMSKIKFEEQRKKIGVDKEEESNKKTNNKSDNKNISSLNKMEGLVSISTNAEQMKKMSSLSKSFKNDAKILKREIETDEGRSLQGTASQYKYDKYNKLQKNIEKLTSNFYDKTTEIKNNLEKMTEEDKQKTESKEKEEK